MIRKFTEDAILFVLSEKELLLKYFVRQNVGQGWPAGLIKGNF